MHSSRNKETLKYFCPEAFVHFSFNPIDHGYCWMWPDLAVSVIGYHHFPPIISLVSTAKRFSKYCTGNNIQTGAGWFRAYHRTWHLVCLPKNQKRCVCSFEGKNTILEWCGRKSRSIPLRLCQDFHFDPAMEQREVATVCSCRIW